MASPTFPLEDVEKDITEDGFYSLEDPAIGKAIFHVARKDFPFGKLAGLDFLQQSVFEDKRLTATLEHFFPKSTLGHWLRYKAYSGHALSSFRGGANAGMHSITIHLWPAGSRGIYFRGSHLHDFKTTVGILDFFEVTHSDLREAGCVGQEISFEQGGVVILDHRTYYEISTGYVIAFRFGTDDLVKGWVPMTLPDTKPYRQKVADMTTKTIGLNYTFENPRDKVS